MGRGEDGIPILETMKPQHLFCISSLVPFFLSGGIVSTLVSQFDMGVCEVCDQA